MPSQVSWFIKHQILEVNVNGILRGYASEQLSQDLLSFVDPCPKNGQIHIMIDVTQMQVSHINVMLLYKALTPLLFEQQIRWIVLYGANEDLAAIFREIMSELFRNPCVLLEDYETALNFLYRKDHSSLEMVEISS